MPVVPQSWHSSTPPARDDATESVHERIQREIDEMKARIIIAQNNSPENARVSVGFLPAD